ncbi:MAG: bacterioferritin [Candidatus Marinimicrobia bacterium]|nr:bacterioferritin [Candidatus Neomarinimicrobiota bacterium]
MPMHEKSITLLNKAVGDELSAILQYMYFHFHCDDQGYELLSGLFRKAAIAEMIHAEQLAERILFLGGDVEMKASHPVEKIQDVRKMLEKARSMEEAAIMDYNKWAIESANNADSVTKKVFEDLTADEEGHYEQYDDELENLDKYGEQYLVLQSMERSKSQSSGQAGE